MPIAYSYVYIFFEISYQIQATVDSLYLISCKFELQLFMADSKDLVKDGHLLLLDEIQDALECVICLDLPKEDPVYQCNNGHIHCNTCHSKITECPVCRIKLGNTRNLTAERVLAKCPKVCKYFKNGCDTVLTKEMLTGHEDCCVYKPVQCPVDDCDTLVPFRDILKHIDDMNDLHKCVYVDKEKTTIDYDHIGDFIQQEGKEKFGPVRMTINKRYFFGVFWRALGPNGLWHVWVYMVGNKEEGKDYVYTIKIVNINLDEEISYTGQTVPLDVGREEIIKSSRCMLFNDEIAKRFCRNDTITFHIDLKHNLNQREQ